MFKINGKTVKDDNDKVIYTNVVNGQVSINYTLSESTKAKNYALTAVYMPTSGDKLEDTKTLTITHKKSIFWIMKKIRIKCEEYKNILSFTLFFK